MNDMNQTIENLNAIKGYFTGMAIALRGSDPRESFRMFKCSEACEKAAEELERLKPMKAELEGGGHSWWNVCGDCHTIINEGDKFCRQCGRRIIWDGMTLEKTPD